MHTSGIVLELLMNIIRGLMYQTKSSPSPAFCSHNVPLECNSTTTHRRFSEAISCFSVLLDEFYAPQKLASFFFFANRLSDNKKELPHLLYNPPRENAFYCKHEYAPSVY